MKSVLSLEEKDTEKSKQSLFHLGKVVFPTHEPTQKHHLAQHPAKKWLTPYFGFGLAHAPNRASGLVRKYSIVGRCVGRQPLFITSGLA